MTKKRKKMRRKTLCTLLLLAQAACVATEVHEVPWTVTDTVHEEAYDTTRPAGLYYSCKFNYDLDYVCDWFWEGAKTTHHPDRYIIYIAYHECKDDFYVDADEFDDWYIGGKTNRIMNEDQILACGGGQ